MTRLVMLAAAGLLLVPGTGVAEAPATVLERRIAPPSSVWQCSGWTDTGCSKSKELWAPPSWELLIEDDAGCRMWITEPRAEWPDIAPGDDWWPEWPWKEFCSS